MMKCDAALVGKREGVGGGLGFFFSSRRRHTRYWRNWSSDVCSSDLRAVWDRLPRDQRKDLETANETWVYWELLTGKVQWWLAGQHGAPATTPERSLLK